MPRKIHLTDSKDPTETEKRHCSTAIMRKCSVLLFLSLLANVGLTYVYYNKYVHEHCEPRRYCPYSDEQPIFYEKITNNRQLNCSDLQEKWFKSNGSFYVFSNDVKNWNSSRERCQALGGDLVIINSDEEQEFISEHVNGVDDYHWIGLTDSLTEGVWLWVDTRPLNSNLFWEFPPDDWKAEDPEGEDCIILKGKKWGDVSCLRREKRICEIPCF